MTGEVSEHKSKEFWFETTWLSHPEFLQRVEMTWQTVVCAKDNLGRFLFKLKKVKEVLKAGART